MGGSIYTVHDVARRTEVLGGELGASPEFDESYLTADGRFLLGNLGATRLIRVEDGEGLGLAYEGRPLVHGAVVDRCYVAFDSNRTGRLLALPFDDDGWGEAVVLDEESELYRPTEFEAGTDLPAANHESSGWKIGNGDGGLDAWYLTSGDQDGPIAGAGEAAWFLTLYRPSTGERRHLAYTDNRVGASTGPEAYNECTFGHLQPNGRGAVFTSVMGDAVGNRSDAFFAFVPLAGSGGDEDR